MTLVTVLSVVGMALGLGGTVPQLMRMARARSAAGQSPVGWGMALAANLTMAYVNGTAFGAVLLAASNLTAATLCVTGLGLIATLGRRPAASASPIALVDELPTLELQILREAVTAAEAARRERKLVAA